MLNDVILVCDPVLKSRDDSFMADDLEDLPATKDVGCVHLAVNKSEEESGQVSTGQRPKWLLEQLNREVRMREMFGREVKRTRDVMNRKEEISVEE